MMMKGTLTLLPFLMGFAIAEKHLVFLAGPRQSGSTDVYNFFYKHAVPNPANTTGLKGWVWPRIKEDLPGEKHRYFENFFWSPHNATLHGILMKSIQNAWKSAKYGVIIGAEGFDNTRGGEQSVGLQIMDEIIGELNVTAKDVHVVMIYQSPRLDQWVNLYHHNAIYDYSSFVCSDAYSEHLANIPMNPFMLASVYRSHAWNVATIDVAGVQGKELDLSHVVACNVLPNTECQDEWITGLEAQTTKTDRFDLGEYIGLSDAEENELEGMFQYRDCSYKKTLQADPGFAVIHKDAVWEYCATSDSELERYHQLTNPEHFFSLIQNQMNCDASDGAAPSTPSPQPEFTGPDDVKVPKSHTISMICLAVVLGMFCTYNIIARLKRRQTHYVKSPTGRTGEDLWIDFGDDSCHVGQPNLRSPSDDDEDGELTDVDLLSPQHMRAGYREATPTFDHMAEAAKEGKSVRGMYRVGLYQNSPLSKHKPHKGDSDIEIKIKNLENELI